MENSIIIGLVVSTVLNLSLLAFIMFLRYDNWKIRNSNVSLNEEIKKLFEACDNYKRVIVGQTDSIVANQEKVEQQSSFARELKSELDRALVVVKEQEAVINELYPLEQQQKDASLFYLNLLINKTVLDSISVSPSMESFGETLQDMASTPKIDWSKPQAFPYGYAVPSGIKCVTLDDDEWDGFATPKGSIVETISSGNEAPFFTRTDGKHRDTASKKDGCLPCYDFAPIDPTDHPLHPEFGKTKTA